MKNYIFYAAIEMPTMLAWLILLAFLITSYLMYKVGTGVGWRKAEERFTDEREEFHNRFIELHDTVPMEALNERTIRNLYPGMLSRGERSRYPR